MCVCDFNSDFRQIQTLYKNQNPPKRFGMMLIFEAENTIRLGKHAVIKEMDGEYLKLIRQE